MSIDLRSDVAIIREASARLRASDPLISDGEFSARLLDAIGDQIEFAADMADESASDIVAERWPTWTAALRLARTVLGDREEGR